MQSHGISRKLFGFLLTLMLAMSMSGCGGGSGSAPAGTTPVAPIAGDSAIIEARTAGGIMAAKVNDVVDLDGTKSVYSSNNPAFVSTNAVLSYDWSFTHVPEGSAALLQNPTSSAPSFTADVAGDYIVQLTVSANGYTSQRALQLIVVTEASDMAIVGPYSGHLGVSSNCLQCHNGVNTYNKNGTLQLITPKPLDHVASSHFCQACHTTRGFAIAVKTDHEEVFGSCSGCHNNVTAVGMSEFHSPIESDCNACHNTVSFLTLEADGSYDHSNITRACQGCHNGKVARGAVDTPIHQPPLSDCGFCHNTASFKGAYPDHTDPNGSVFGKRCDSCHNDDLVNGIGRSSTGFHPADMSIAGDGSLDCDVCHSVTQFKTGGFNHASIDISLNPQEPACFKCHNDATTNIGATQMPNDVNHSGLTINQDLDCFICHSTEAFAGATFFDHSVLAPGKLCADCHGDLAPVNPGDIDATGIPAPTATYQHVDTNGADCGACHTPGTFTTGIFDHSTVDLVANRCDSCHNGVISTGLSSFADHIPLMVGSPADCDVCHTTTDYSSFATPIVMTHTDAGVDISVCAACHDGIKSVGKSVGHIPTRALDCIACHYDASSYTTFTVTTWDHAAIPSNDTDCASCHATGYATAKHATHIPSVAECSVCHTSTSDFTVTNFRTAVHDSLTEGCEGCHVSRLFPDAADANKYKASSHLPTSQDCQFCHSASAVDFSDYSNFAHTGITSNCASCHDGSFVGVLPNAKGKPSDTIHNTVTADCSICHTTSNNFLDGAYVDHSSPDIQNVRCDNCHNGDFTFNTPPAPVIKGKNFIPNSTNTNTHPVTSSDCSVCHSSDPAIDFKDGGVDHSSPAVQAQRCDACHGSTATGMSVNHVPTGSDDCGSCHIAGGAFKPSTFSHSGITNNCTSCHDGSYVSSGALGEPNDTLHTTDNSDCSVCHNTVAFAGASFDHSGITASTRCDTCHNGNAASGKEPPLGHVPTSQDCRACHVTSGFIPGTFDHSQNSASARCDSCHNTNPGYATPKSATHIDTSQDCGTCHFGFDTFAGAVFDHSGVTASTRCDSCHVDGSATATGKDDALPTHLVTSLDCRSCHNANAGTFAGGSWTHDASSAGNCTNCHVTNGGATPKPSGHINATAQCDWCHNTSNWSFSHSTSNYPGTHSTRRIAANGCNECHTGNFPNSVFPITTANFPWSERADLAPYCVACHYNDGRREHSQSRIENTSSSGYANCGRSGCHRVSSSSW